MARRWWTSVPFAVRPATVCSINASGQVSGFAWASVVNNVTHYHAYRWRNDGTAPVDLDKSGGAHDSRGDKINDAGQVIGSAWSTAANAYHAFTWRSNGTAVDLGTLGGTRSEAHDINRAGWVVGTSTLSAADNSYYNAFLWIDNGQGTKNLNDLVDPADPLKSQVVLSNAFAINDAGDIAVVGTNGHLYLLRGSQLALDPTSLAFGNQHGRQLERCQDGDRPESYGLRRAHHQHQIGRHSCRTIQLYEQLRQCRSGQRKVRDQGHLQADIERREVSDVERERWRQRIARRRTFRQRHLVEGLSIGDAEGSNPGAKARTSIPAAAVTRSYADTFLMA